MFSFYKECMNKYKIKFFKNITYMDKFYTFNAWNFNIIYNLKKKIIKVLYFSLKDKFSENYY